ncbi:MULTISPECIES: DNA-binding protein [Cupriavidus]
MIPAQEVREVLVPKAFYAILQEQGRPPTVDLVTEWLVAQGHGKPYRNVISEGIKACFAEVGRRLQSSVFEALPEETVRLVVALRDDMHAQARREFDEERTQHRVAAQAQVEAANAALGEARLARDEAHQQLDRTQDELRAQAQTLAHQANALKAAEATGVDLRARLDRAEGDLDMTRRSVQALEAAAHAREREHSAALMKAQADLADEHKRGLLAIERERAETKSARKAAEDAHTRIEQLGAQERERVRQVAVLETELATERLARRQLQETGAKQLADAEQALAAGRESLLQAQEEKAALAARLDAMATQAQALGARLAGFGSLSPLTLADLLGRAYLLGGTAPVPAGTALTDTAHAADGAARRLLAPFDVALPPADAAPGGTPDTPPAKPSRAKPSK